MLFQSNDVLNLDDLDQDKASFLAHQVTHIVGELLLGAAQAHIRAILYKSGEDPDVQTVSGLNWPRTVLENLLAARDASSEDDGDLHKQLHELADLFIEEVNNRAFGVIEMLDSPVWDLIVGPAWKAARGEAVSSTSLIDILNDLIVELGEE